VAGAEGAGLEALLARHVSRPHVLRGLDTWAYGAAQQAFAPSRHTRALRQDAAVARAPGGGGGEGVGEARAFGVAEVRTAATPSLRVPRAACMLHMHYRTARVYAHVWHATARHACVFMRVQVRALAALLGQEGLAAWVAAVRGRALEALRVGAAHRVHAV
jgi:hypothetical protein